MPKGKPTPDYKFRLLCRRCNSYMHTTIDSLQGEGYVLECTACGVTAESLDETTRPRLGKIEVSDDGTTWREVEHDNGTFKEPQTCRFIRVDQHLVVPVARSEFYISTHLLGSGYAAVMIVKDPDGFQDIQQTGIGRYKTQAEAIVEAKQWAEAEELEYRE